MRPSGKYAVATAIIVVLGLATAAAFVADFTTTGLVLAAALLTIATLLSLAALMSARRSARSLAADLSALRQTSQSLATRLGETGGPTRAEASAMYKGLMSAVTKSAQSVAVAQQFVARHEPAAILPFPGGWALDGAHLADLVELVRRERPLLILELGSGASTTWLAYEAQRYGGRIVSIDHLEHYADVTRAALETHGLRAVADVRVAPLEDSAIEGHTTQWYAKAAFADLVPGTVDLLLVDGPPAALGPAARFPALPFLRPLLAPGAIVLLDDTFRADELDTLERWRAQLGDAVGVPLLLSPGIDGFRVQAD